ncbi:hypothetical protein GCM10009111_28900 [Colwellia asteriadis]|uniref:SH3 domain-containing protein n=1 Tax=Colwellia asteriadis TaxID=517723 RepID=A0ABP3WJ77_9GAMM
MKSNAVFSFSAVALATMLLTVTSVNANTERSARLINDAPLLKQANPQGEVIAVLTQGVPITVKSRQRAWYFITQDSVNSTPNSSKAKQNSVNHHGVSGWVSMLSVRFLAQAKRQGESGLEGVLASTGNDTLSTVSTGIRGIDENDIQSAEANLEQVKLLSSYATTKESALAFAKAGELVTQKVQVKEDN